MHKSLVCDDVVKVVFVDDYDRVPLPSELHGSLNLSPVAGVSPAWVTIGTDDEIVNLLRNAAGSRAA